MSLLYSLPFRLVVAIAAALALGQVCAFEIVQGFYTLSMVVIEILMLVLPVMVFCFLCNAIMGIKKGAASLVLLIFLGVSASHFIALWTAYGVGSIFLPLLNITNQDVIALTTSKISTITPKWSLGLAWSFGTEKIMIAAISLGLLMSYLPQNNSVRQWFTTLVSQGVYAITWFLKYIFLPLLPLYVFGFCMKLSFEKSFLLLFQSYGKVFILSIILVILYIGLLYRLGSTSWGKFKKNIATMMPAFLTGFSTMSSAATLPVTMECSEKMIKDPDLARLLVPATGNIHMVGDCLTVTIAALALTMIFGKPWPDAGQFFSFSIGFLVARLSGVGVPAGSLLVVLPVIERSFGFSPEMISLLTTIYVLQDSFGTASNVMGNGAFALFGKKLEDRLKLMSR